MIQGSNSGRGERSFQTTLGGPHIFLSKGTNIFLLGVIRRGGESERSTPSNTDTKNQWRCLSTLPIRLQQLVKVKTGLSHAKQEHTGQRYCSTFTKDQRQKGLGILYPQKKAVTNFTIGRFCLCASLDGSKESRPSLYLFETSSPCCVTIPNELPRPALKYRARYNY